MRYLLILFISIFAFACSQTESPDEQQTEVVETEQQNEQKEPTQEQEVYTVNGKVKSLPPGGKFIIIRHEEIPGFMNAMEMPFNLKNPELAENVEPKDSVNFTFEVTSGKMTITELNVLE